MNLSVNRHIFNLLIRFKNVRLGTRLKVFDKIVVSMIGFSDRKSLSGTQNISWMAVYFKLVDICFDFMTTECELIADYRSIYYERQPIASWEVFRPNPNYQAIFSVLLIVEKTILEKLDSSSWSTLLIEQVQL